MSQDYPPQPGFRQTQPVAREALDSNLEQAREQIVTLQRKKEELERAKGELEEMRRRHDEFARGRVEIVEALNRGLVVLEHEQVETQRMADLIARTRQTFKEQLTQVETLTDAHWDSENLKSELSKSLAMIETARMEFNRACLRIDALQNKSPEDMPQTPLEKFSGPVNPLDRISFGQAMKLGFAFSLPLVLILLILVLTLLVKW
jgi:DNA repair exonuclease SbcCD ATPase subunit